MVEAQESFNILDLGRRNLEDRNLSKVQQYWRNFSLEQRKLMGKENPVFEAPDKVEFNFIKSLSKVVYPPLKITFKDLHIDSKEVEAEIGCMICHEILCQPVACSECMALTCADCIKEWFEKQGSMECVQCKKEFQPIPKINDAYKIGDRYDYMTSELLCFACLKPFILNEWDEHREICEKSKIECCCGMVVQATHKLNEEGNLIGKANEYSDKMTALDMHIWYECEKVKSNCMTCGYVNTRENFEAYHTRCESWSGETWKNMLDRTDWITQRCQEIGVGQSFVCPSNRRLIRHEKCKPWFYTGQVMHCDNCKIDFDPYVSYNPMAYFRCGTDEKCQCNYDICRRCMCCPNEHPLKRWTNPPNVLDIEAKCAECGEMNI